ncbi:MAG: hypothetical protein EBX50_22380, partial [Chitinophagia bacterium]|nr:hypothetical protein [Chitinophagia bacterium]
VFTTIQAAQNAAAAGDTLYIHGSLTQYTGGTIEKQLVIIGEGALPNKNFKFIPQIAGLTFGFNANNTVSSSGSKIYGCALGIIIGTNSAATQAVNNITIQRCNMNNLIFSGYQSSPNTGLLISNNVINYITAGVIANSVIRNNIVISVSYVGDQSTSAWVFTNNIVLGYFAFNQYATVTNNIFYRATSNADNLYLQNNAYCTISKNLYLDATGSTTITPSDIVYGTNNGGNNILNQDPFFVNPDVNIISYSFTYPTDADPTANFRLQANSPAIGYGTDGTDLGIYGGAVPFFEGTPTNSRYRYFPMPWIPAVLDMNIQNSSILQNGTLNVNFIARKQN